MFDPLAPADVVAGIGRTTRAAARSEEPSSEFSRGQLLSAFSATRHLGVELARFGSEARACAQRLTALLQEAGLDAHAAAVGAVRDPQGLGDAAAELLVDLRADAGATALRATVQHELRILCDREVALLAEVIEAPR